MGFISDLLLGPKCKYCGRHSLQNKNVRDEYGDVNYFCHVDGINVMYCESCQRVGSYGRIPRCHICGCSQTSIGKNKNGMWVPKCPKCGYLYDGYE